MVGLSQTRLRLLRPERRTPGGDVSNAGWKTFRSRCPEQMRARAHEEKEVDVC